MNESPIDQLHCTHCTYGTSALYRADDARKDQVFEYSTRASSVDRNRTHQLFQLVEQYVKFQLPGDTPAADLLRYTAETCHWQRLAYYPSISGFRVLAHSCYRQTDTRQRPGSYFAHVLLSDSTKAAPDWSAIDGLRLWGSPEWAVEDSMQTSFDLPKAAPFSLWTGYEAVINDANLLAFLSTPPGDAFSESPADEVLGVIPQRWRTTPLAERRQLLIDLLGTVTQLNIERHEKLVIAVEPGLAALLFYGVLRLLPGKGLAEKISFSTYQSHLENPTTTLAACSFSNTSATDLLPDAYRGAAINTFNGRRGQGIRSAQYAAATYLVETWANDDTGRLTIESLLRAAKQVGVTQIKEFEELIAADQLVRRLLVPDPKTPPIERDLPRLKVSRLYIQQTITDELSRMTPNSSSWTRLASIPGHSLLLAGLLGTADAPPEAQSAAEMICRQSLPEEDFFRLLTAPGITDKIKTNSLCQFFLERGALPPKCNVIWDSPPAAGLPPDILVRMLKQLDSGRRNAFLELLTQGFDKVNPTDQDIDRYITAVRALLASFQEFEVVNGSLLAVLWPPSCHPAFVRALLQDHTLREPVLRLCDVTEPVLSDLVSCLLTELSSEPNQFRTKLSVLKASARFLKSAEKKELASWNSIVDLLTRLEQELKQSGGWLKFGGRNSKTRLLNAERDGLAGWIAAALPKERYLDDDDGTKRAGIVADVAKDCLAPIELPKTFAQTVASIICPQMTSPPSASAPRRKSQKPLHARKWRILISIGITLLAIGGGVAIWKKFPTLLNGLEITTASKRPSRTKHSNEQPPAESSIDPSVNSKVAVRRQKIDPPALDADVTRPSERDDRNTVRSEGRHVPDAPTPQTQLSPPSPQKSAGTTVQPDGPKAWDVDAHKGQIVNAHRLVLREDTSDEQTLGCPASSSPPTFTLHGPIVPALKSSQDSAIALGETYLYQQESNELQTPLKRRMTISIRTEEGIEPFVTISAVAGQTPTITLIPTGAHFAQALESLRTRVLRISYATQLPESIGRDYYLAFVRDRDAPTRPGLFGPDAALSLSLPKTTHSLSLQANSLVASAATLTLRGAQREVLCDAETYIRVLRIPERLVEPTGRGETLIRFEDDKLRIYANLSSSAARGDVKPGELRHSDVLEAQASLVNSLWDLWDKRKNSGYQSSARDRKKIVKDNGYKQDQHLFLYQDLINEKEVMNKIRQNKNIQPIQVPGQQSAFPFSIQQAYRNYGSIKDTLTNACKCSNVVAEQLGVNTYDMPPQWPGPDAKIDQWKFVTEDVFNWISGWLDQLNDLSAAREKRTQELKDKESQKRADKTKSNTTVKKQEGGSSPLAGACFTGIVYFVIDGKFNTKTGKLDSGIVVELVRFDAKTSSPRPERASNGKKD